MRLRIWSIHLRGKENRLHWMLLTCVAGRGRRSRRETELETGSDGVLDEALSTLNVSRAGAAWRSRRSSGGSGRPSTALLNVYRTLRDCAATGFSWARSLGCRGAAPGALLQGSGASLR